MPPPGEVTRKDSPERAHGYTAHHQMRQTAATSRPTTGCWVNAMDSNRDVITTDADPRPRTVGCSSSEVVCGHIGDGRTNGGVKAGWKKQSRWPDS